MKHLISKTTFFFTIACISVLACNKTSNNPPSTTSCTGGPTCQVPVASGETAGTTPSGIVGVHVLTYHQSATGAPFTDGNTATIELTSDNKMVVTYNNQCVTIENPIQTSPVEVAFKDNCQFNVSFAASQSTNGGLNEVNVNASVGGQFLGQFR